MLKYQYGGLAYQSKSRKKLRVVQYAVCIKVPPQPLKTILTPDYSWQKVGMDLYEWKGAQYLLIVIVEYFSRWIEIVLLKHTSSSKVIEHTKLIFA